MESPSPASVLDFPLGLPGFEHSHQFTLAEFAPGLFTLESLEPQNIRFYAISVSGLDATYQFDIDRSTAELLRISSESDDSQVLALAILTSGEKDGVTANLLAPILINGRSGIGVQVIRSDTKYSHRHPVISPAATSGPSGDAPCL